MLEMGASIYEARANAVGDQKDVSAGNPQSLTLHTKLMLIDERYLFVGSLNLDPRSIEINAEMGLLIDSPEMAKQFMEEVSRGLDDVTYKVEMNSEGHLRWRATIEGEEVVETREPLTSWWRRFQSRVYRILPESQL